MERPQAVLIVDDDDQILRPLKFTLESSGYSVHAVRTGGECIRQCTLLQPDLVILDLGLPDMDGVQVLKTLRKSSSIPVLILSVRNSEAEMVGAFEAGADDYLAKPFRSGELLARIRTALRYRGRSSKQERSCFGAISIDFDSRLVRKNNEIVKLTSTEYLLLELFARNVGKVLTYGYIVGQVWGISASDKMRELRVYVSQLRQKLEDNPDFPGLLVTESGIGYRFTGNL